MGRLVRATHIVEKRIEPEGRAEGVDGTADDGSPETKQDVKQQGDTYLERVAKYVPAEVVAFFIFASAILKQSKEDLTLKGAKAEGLTIADLPLDKVGVAVFMLAWLCVPIYLWRQARAGDATFVNAAMSTAVFPIWCYAVDGVGVGTVFHVPYDGHLASIVLGAASLLSGLIAPMTKTTVA